MFISSLSPESLVEDPNYVAIIAEANPRLTTLSRSTLSRATSSRSQALHDEERAALDCVSVCHVNTDMWTSLASEWVTNAINSKQRREPSTHVTIRYPPVLAR